MIVFRIKKKTLWCSNKTTKKIFWLTVFEVSASSDKGKPKKFPPVPCLLKIPSKANIKYFQNQGLIFEASYEYNRKIKELDWTNHLKKPNLVIEHFVKVEKKWFHSWITFPNLQSGTSADSLFLPKCNFNSIFESCEKIIKMLKISWFVTCQLLKINNCSNFSYRLILRWTQIMSKKWTDMGTLGPIILVKWNSLQIQ